MKETATQLKSDETLSAGRHPAARSRSASTRATSTSPTPRTSTSTKDEAGAGTMTADYEKTVPMFGNLHLLMVFKKTVAIN